MWSSVKGFVSRHRRKFMVGSIVIGSVIFIRYTQRKLRDWQEKEIREMLGRTIRPQYFHYIEKICNQAIKSLAPTLGDSIIEVLDTEIIVNKLRNGCTDKVAYWNELKVLAIARSAAIIYSYAMIATLTRIQFNIIGSHILKVTKTSKGGPAEDILQDKYMRLSSHFRYDGINKLCSLIKDKVVEITASISLKDELTLRDIEEIYWAITSSISTDSSRDPVKNLTAYMLQTECNDEKDPVFLKLINETLDLLETEEVQNITQSNIRRGFSLLVDHMSEFFVGPSTKENGKTPNGISVPGTSNQNHMSWREKSNTEVISNTFVNINKVSMPMAKIIPVINGQVPDKSMPQGFQTELLDRLVRNEELKTLGANIYEAFSSQIS